MSIELTDAQSQALAAEGDAAVVVDPRTERQYHLVPATPRNENQAAESPLPAAVQASRAALLRDLPDLLKIKKNRGQCVCYQGNRRIGIARFRYELQNECAGLGIPHDEYYIGVIEEQEFTAEEVIDGYRPDLVEEYPETSCPSS